MGWKDGWFLYPEKYIQQPRRLWMARKSHGVIAFSNYEDTQTTLAIIHFSDSWLSVMIKHAVLDLFANSFCCY